MKIIKKVIESFIKWFDNIPTWFLSYLSLVVSMIAFVVAILLKNKCQKTNKQGDDRYYTRENSIFFSINSVLVCDVDLFS